MGKENTSDKVTNKGTAFAKHLAQSSQIVGKWPAWKQVVLGSTKGQDVTRQICKAANQGKK